MAKYNFGPNWVKTHDSMDEAADKEIKREAKKKALKHKLQIKGKTITKRSSQGSFLGREYHTKVKEEK